MLEAGDPAPEFTLPDHEGEPVSLSSYRGRHVVVYFYPRADTPGCTAEACSFRDAYAEFTDRDVAVLGISDDPVEDIAAFADSYDLPFRLLSDEGGDVARAYDSYGEKQYGGRTFDGTYRNTFVVGPDGTVEHAFEGVSPDGHAAEVLSVIDG
jgi:peroxiredoxin Q/BCP